jgi:hypothetical protein
MYGAMGYLHARLWRAVDGVAEGGRRLRRSAEGEGGQGTVEYIALILLVALIMAGVVVAMRNYKGDEGKDLGAIILGKMKEAIARVKF